MPIETRCPACSAAVPSGAAWCSLCHAELRPRTATNATSVDVVPSGRTRTAGTSTVTTARPAAASARSAAEFDAQEAAADLSAYAADRDADAAHPVDLDLDQDIDAVDDEPVGRHSRRDPEPAPSGRRAAPATSQPSGRRGARTATAGSTLGTLELEGVVIPQGVQVSHEEADALADQLIQRLALSETRPRMLDPDDIPGGRWTLIGGGMTAVLAVLLVMFTVLGAVLNR